MENKFKEGDIVEYVEAVGCDIELGNKYKAEYVGAFHIVVTKDGKFVGRYKKRRFKLAKQEQKPNYMMVWNDSEKAAKKKEVVTDLTNNPRFIGSLPIKCLSSNGKYIGYKYCKSIERWKKDNILFKNSLYEEFFEGDTVYWVIISTNEIKQGVIAFKSGVFYGGSEVITEIMTKESVEKYVKEHQPKYRPFTMEEFIEVNNNWIISKITKEGLYVVSCNSKDVYVHDGTISYEALLRDYTFKNGTPCGVKE